MPQLKCTAVSLNTGRSLYSTKAYFSIDQASDADLKRSTGGECFTGDSANWLYASVAFKYAFSIKPQMRSTSLIQNGGLWLNKMQKTFTHLFRFWCWIFGTTVKRLTVFTDNWFTGSNVRMVSTSSPKTQLWRAHHLKRKHINNTTAHGKLSGCVDKIYFLKIILNEQFVDKINRIISALFYFKNTFGKLFLVITFQIMLQDMSQ